MGIEDGNGDQPAALPTDPPALEPEAVQPVGPPVLAAEEPDVGPPLLDPSAGEEAEPAAQKSSAKRRRRRLIAGVGSVAVLAVTFFGVLPAATQLWSAGGDPVRAWAPTPGAPPDSGGICDRTTWIQMTSKDAYLCAYFNGAKPATEIPATPGDVLTVILEYQNISTERRDNVTFTAERFDRLTILPGSTWTNSSHLDGEPFDGAKLYGSGVNLGSYAPSGNVWISLPLQIATADKFSCGHTAIPVRFEAGSYGGTRPVASAIVDVARRC